MSNTTVCCHKCKIEYKYNESADKANNDLIPKKIRKVIVDTNGLVFPFYAMPPDKQKIVDEKFIKFECSKCNVPVES